MTKGAWLIFRASDSSLRIINQRPRLRWDEITWRIVLNIPEPWGKLAGEVEITLPEGPPSEIKVTAIGEPSA